MRRVTWLRAVVGALAVLGCLATSRPAEAQSLTLPTGFIPSRQNVSIRPDSLNPTWINRSDCLNDAVLEFSLSGTFPTGSGGYIETWAGTGSADCRTQQARTVNTGSALCWPVSGQVMPGQNVQINVHARDIIGQHGFTATPHGPGSGTVEDCATAAMGIDTPQAVTLYFLYLPQGGLTDAAGTTPTYALKFDLLGPAPPQGFSAGIGEGLLELDWNQSGSVDTSGYVFYCDPPPGQAPSGNVGLLDPDAGFADGGAEAICPMTDAGISGGIGAGGSSGTGGTTGFGGTVSSTGGTTTSTGGTLGFDPPPPAPCTPGTTISCACLGMGDVGVQTCQADGASYGPCQCPSSGTGGVSGAGGTSGVGGVSGAAGTSGAAGNGGAAGTSSGNGGAGGDAAGSGGTLDTGGTSTGTSGTNGSSGTSGSAGTSATSNVCGSSCPSLVLFPNVDPNNTQTGSKIQALECGRVTGLSATHAVVDGLLNNSITNVSVAAIDAVGNIGTLSTVECKAPRPIDDFYKLYREAGGNAGGGYCQQSGALGALQAAGGYAPWLALGAAGIARVLRRRGRR